MKKQLVATIIIVSLPFLFISCVSSLLKDNPPTFSKEITFIEPAKPFIRMTTSVYPSWKSTQSGNVISIVSDCDVNSPYSLNNLHLLIEDSLSSIKIIKEDSVSLDNKPAMKRLITARLDEHEIEVESIAFKRKSCGYISSLSGKINTLAQDKSQFEQFNTGLRFE